MSELWSDMFASTTFLLRIQMRVQEHSKKCSSCRSWRKIIRKPRGKISVGLAPTGIMRIDELPELTCSGYDAGAFLISYRFESGIQKEYHLNQGESFSATYREAYLPANEQGRDLLKRLKFAFSRGLTFDVGESITTGTQSSIIWSTIPHKTSLGPGTFGFPDSEYFAVANKELDSLEVPSADKL